MVRSILHSRPPYFSQVNLHSHTQQWLFQVFSTVLKHLTLPPLPTSLTNLSLQNDLTSQFTKTRKRKAEMGIPSSSCQQTKMPASTRSRPLPPVKTEKHSFLLSWTSLSSWVWEPVSPSVGSYPTVIIPSSAKLDCLLTFKHTQSPPSKTKRTLKPLIPHQYTPFSYHFLSSTSQSKR